MEASQDRFVVHVDMDAFFASIEQRDNPAYRGKSVIVGADPKAGKGRGVVSTCSYEARNFGIHSAMPISTAYRKCARAVFLPVEMKKYALVSDGIFKILREFSPAVEQISIDEAFLDISATYQLHGTPAATCMEIRRRIKSDTALAASIGLASTKMAAKIASGLAKPDGFLEVRQDRLLDFLWPLDIEKMWGIGPKTKMFLNRRGIRTIGELAAKGKNELAGLLGRNGLCLWEMAQGIDDRPVEAEREAKSVGNETTFESDTLDRKMILAELYGLSEEVSYRLRQNGFKCRTITLKIRLEDFRTYTRSSAVSPPTNLATAISRKIMVLYDNFGMRNKKVRLVGVKVSHLLVTEEEKCLFTDKADDRQEKIQKALDNIREKYGKRTIFRAVA